jgi:hypothetical protein
MPSGQGVIFSKPHKTLQSIVRLVSELLGPIAMKAGVELSLAFPTPLEWQGSERW